MGALRNMIQARKAELEALAERQSAAGLIDVTDADRIKALAALLARGSGSVSPDDDDRLAALDALVARHRARAGDVSPDASGDPPASEPAPAAPVAPPPVARTSEPPTEPGEPLPPGVIPDASAYVPPPRPPVVEPAPEPVHQAMPMPGQVAIRQLDPTVAELQRLWRRGLPSGIERVVEMYGWPAVLAAMRPGESAREFKVRVEAGHAQADEAARRVASARGLDRVRARQAGRIA